MKSKLLLAALIVSVFAPNVNAAVDVADQPCDAEYWEAMSARAWMEAEREIMQNQNLIAKPDSVFEYVCFDRILAHTATNAGKIFSHTTYFGDVIIPENAALGMRNSLGRSVYEALKVYVKGNFDHTFLGDRAQHMDANSSDTNMDLSATAADYTSLFSGGYGTCQIMKDIWKTSKCANFVDNANFDGTGSSQTSDGFYPFTTIKHLTDASKNIKSYQSDITDPRGLPEQCTGRLSADYLSWAGPTARINNFQRDNFTNPLKAVFTDVYNLTVPKAQTASGECGPAIPTGVTVYTQSGEYLDGVCSNAGCTYKKGSASAIGTCE